MKYFLIIGALLYSTMAAGQIVKKSRCAEDSLSISQAIGRVNWAVKCGHIQATEDETAEEVAHNWLYEYDTDKPRARPIYPIYLLSDASNPANYRAPTKEGSSCALPTGYMMRAACRSSCYKPGERFLSDTGYVALGKAQDLETPKIIGLSPKANRENLSFESFDVGSYSKSIVATSHRMVSLRTRSGGALSVTDNHPLVTGDGVMVEAIKLKVGDQLLRASGKEDEIVAISVDEWQGKVYNVAPKTSEQHANIIVAEGFLSGSSWYQNDGANLLDKTVLRSSSILDALLD